MASINDVARLAGVSKGTVSSVFSRKRAVSAEAEERVRRAAKELNYRPNYIARTLASKETRIIGLVMPVEQVKFSSFHLSLLNGVLDICFQHGYRLLVNALSSEYRQRLEWLASDPVDGEVLLDPSTDDARIGYRLESGVPLVVVGRPPEPYASRVTYVNNDNVDAARQLTESLLNQGHRNIVFLNSECWTTVAQDRAVGFRMAYDTRHLGQPLVLYKEAATSSVDFGLVTARQALEEDPTITAFITDNHVMALGVYRAVEALGLSIPDHVSVATFNVDSQLVPEFKPSLSGVDLNAELLGMTAADLLIAAILAKDTTIKQVMVPSELVLRESCAPVR